MNRFDSLTAQIAEASAASVGVGSGADVFGLEGATT